MILASQRRLWLTSRCCTAPTAIGAGIGRVSGNLPVTQYYQHRTGADSGFRIITQGADRLFQCGFPDQNRVTDVLHGNNPDHGSVIVRNPCASAPVRPYQPVCLAFRFVKKTFISADAGGERHNMGFPQRIDRRLVTRQTVGGNSHKSGADGQRVPQTGYHPPLSRPLPRRFPQHPQHLLQLFRGVPNCSDTPPAVHHRKRCGGVLFIRS